MRTVFILCALCVAEPADAAGLVMPEEKPVFHAQAYNSPEIAQPWVNRQAGTTITEKPIGEILATRLGVADGTAELFRFRVENAPSSKTVLDGMIDGGGIKLKLSW